MIHQVYEPQLRALLGTASHYCEAIVLESSAVPIGSPIGIPIMPCQARDSLLELPFEKKDSIFEVSESRIVVFDIR